MFMIRKSNFKIEKLYLDCIDEQGNCFIIYFAKLKFFFLRLFYSGFIFSDREGNTREKFIFRKSESSIFNDSLHFNQNVLKIDGKWNRMDAPIFLKLYKDEKGNELTWNCHHPKSVAEIFYNNITYTGFGYAETLFLPIRPRDLPIDELRWGRFLSEAYTIIWINWKGKNPVNRIFLNNVEYNDATFNDGMISFCDGIYQLIFSEIAEIRKGRLRNHFSGISFLKFLFNRRILNTIEIKYKSKTIFSKNTMTLSNGWSLFEIVSWAK
jgi:hypothetical protein